MPVRSAKLGAGEVMDVDDQGLILGLEARDGAMPERTRSHWSTGRCRYSEEMEGRPCPWCEAERRRSSATPTEPLAAAGGL